VMTLTDILTTLQAEVSSLESDDDSPSLDYPHPDDHTSPIYDLYDSWVQTIYKTNLVIELIPPME